jgi:hypothetical protein
MVWRLGSKAKATRRRRHRIAVLSCWRVWRRPRYPRRAGPSGGLVAPALSSESRLRSGPASAIDRTPDRIRRESGPPKPHPEDTRKSIYRQGYYGRWNSCSCFPSGKATGRAFRPWRDRPGYAPAPPTPISPSPHSQTHPSTGSPDPHTGTSTAYAPTPTPTASSHADHESTPGSPPP